MLPGTRMFRVLAALALSMILLTASLEALQPRLAEQYRCALERGETEWSRDLVIPPEGLSGDHWTQIELLPVEQAGGRESNVGVGSHFQVTAEGSLARTALWELQADLPSRPGVVLVQVVPSSLDPVAAPRQRLALEALVNTLRQILPALKGPAPRTRFADTGLAMPTRFADVRN